MSPREIAWRAGSRLRTATARTRARARPDWGGESWSATLRTLAGTRRDEFVADADRIARGELSLWGHEVHMNPAAPEWQRDPLRGIDAASAERDWSRDRKAIWELHRQQHLFPLAAGAALAGRADWARLCAGQMLNWIARNPPKTFPGWSSGYETSHRLVGWAWTVPLIADYVPRPQLDRIGESYAIQADFAALRPSRYSSANNHRLAELTGLLAAALMGVGSERWDGLWAELEAEVPRQLYLDGGSREQAGGYFLYVLEILWVAGVLSNGAGHGLGDIRRPLAAMLTWLEEVCDPSWEPPPVGDDAEDRMLRVEYFQPRRAATIAERARGLLAGEPGLRVAKPAPVPGHSAFLPASGYAIFRGAPAGTPVRVVLDVGELGFGPLAAHGHADALAVLVDHGDRPVLQDSGTGSYGPADGRDDFRITAAHNTITVDDLSQAEPLGPHLWGRRFRTNVESAVLGASIDYVRASHDGYRSYPSEATHTRSVAYLKPDLLLVLDRVQAERSCRATLAWHVASDEELNALCGGSVAMAVASCPEVGSEVREVPVSSRYGSQETARRHAWTAGGTDIVFATLLAFGTGRRSDLQLYHEFGHTEVEVHAPRRLSVIESWRESGVEVAELAEVSA